MKVKHPSKFRIVMSGLVLVIITCWAYLSWRSGFKPKDIRRIVMISIDTCRADHLGCYGYQQQTTPNIDAVARQGAVFENVISPVPLTLPAHSSMLTGTIPPYHGVHDNEDYRLAPSNVCLAEILQAQGFITAAIVSAFVLDSRFGIDQGFESYHDRFLETRGDGIYSERRGAETSSIALEWLEEHEQENFFLFLHYYDPHGDYHPPEPFASKFASNLYAGEIAYADYCIGQVINKLKELKLYDSTLIIITSDHGEMLGEHGEPTHGFFVYESAIRVPLILKLPGREKPRRIKELATLVDIVPTVCGLLGIEAPQGIQGIDQSAKLLGKRESKENRQYMYCESLAPTKSYNANPLLGLVSSDGWKYIDTTRPELYNLFKDPQETNNLVGQMSRRARTMQVGLLDILENTLRKNIGSKMESNTEVLRRLESLGYVSGSTQEEFVIDPAKEDPKDLIEFEVTGGKLLRLVKTRKYLQAKDLAWKMIQRRPDIPQWYKYLGRIALEQGDFTRAIDNLQKVLEREGERPQTFDNLGSAYKMLGKNDEAIRHYRRAVQLDPEFAEAHSNLGVTLAEQGNVDDAIKHYYQALRINPDLARTRCNLGLLLQSRGQMNEALEHFRHAQEIKPDDAEAHYHLSNALLSQAEPEEALVHARRAAFLTRHENPFCLDTLAAAYAALGQFDQAVTTAQKALIRASDAQDRALAAQLRRRLELYKQSQPYAPSLPEQDREATDN